MMTTDPEAKNVTYSVRLRSVRTRAVVAEETATLNATASRCHDLCATADIMSGGRVIGAMSADGLIDWYE